MKSELEPRYKLLFIPHHLVLQSVAFCTIGDALFPKNQCANKLAEIFRLIPDDTEIRHASIPFTRRGFLFTLYHKSFDVVGDFAEIPEIEWSIQREIVETVEPESMKVNFPGLLKELAGKEIALMDAKAGISPNELERIDEEFDPVINFFK